MRWACVVAALALAVALCVTRADAFSPHRAMTSRGPVSPFPLEPLAPAPPRTASAGPARAPTAAAAKAPAQPQTQPHATPLTAETAAALKLDVTAVNAFVDKYVKAWEFDEKEKEKWSASAPLQLTAVAPQIQALLQKFKPLQTPAAQAELHAVAEAAKSTNTPQGKSHFVRALKQLYGSSVASFRLTELPNTRKVAYTAKTGSAEAAFQVTVDLKAALTPKGAAAAVTLPARATLTLGGEPMLIRSEKLAVRARTPAAAIKSAAKKH